MKWFRKTVKDIPPPIDEDEYEDESIDEEKEKFPHDPLRPMQYPAPRVESVYITDSEREMYLAALDGLDKPAPQLVLRADPPPVIPPPKSVTPIITPVIPYPATPLPFPPQKPTKHAILTLADDSGVGFTGFPAKAIASADEALMTWPRGVAARSGPVESLESIREPIVFRVKLKGKVWHRKGSEELESIRLLISVFTALGKHGWKMAGSMAPMGRLDTHNLLFKYTGTDSPPPLFFALMQPLPDRLSLVSTPSAATDQLIDAVRACIFEAASEIKLEGWIHRGVYRFWIAGLRRLGGLKRDTVSKLFPPLMVSIMDSLSVLHFEWLNSVPLESSGPGRDILFFASTAQSGLSAKDSFEVKSAVLSRAKATPGQVVPILRRVSSPELPSPTVPPPPKRKVLDPIQSRPPRNPARNTHSTFGSGSTLGPASPPRYLLSDDVPEWKEGQKWAVPLMRPRRIPARKTPGDNPYFSFGSTVHDPTSTTRVDGFVSVKDRANVFKLNDSCDLIERLAPRHSIASTSDYSVEALSETLPVPKLIPRPSVDRATSALSAYSRGMPATPDSQPSLPPPPRKIGQSYFHEQEYDLLCSSRLSVSDMSIMSGSSASSRRTGVGSSRARLSVTRAV